MEGYDDVSTRKSQDYANDYGLLGPVWHAFIERLHLLNVLATGGRLRKKTGSMLLEEKESL